MIVIYVGCIFLDMCFYCLVGVWVWHFFVVIILEDFGDVAVQHCKQGYVESWSGN